MYALFKHKSFNSKEAEFKVICKIHGGGGYQLVQVLYSSPRVTGHGFGLAVAYHKMKIE